MCIRTDANQNTQTQTQTQTQTHTHTHTHDLPHTHDKQQDTHSRICRHNGTSECITCSCNGMDPREWLHNPREGLMREWRGAASSSANGTYRVSCEQARSIFKGHGAQPGCLHRQLLQMRGDITWLEVSEYDPFVFCIWLLRSEQRALRSPSICQRRHAKRRES